MRTTIGIAASILILAGCANVQECLEVYNACAAPNGEPTDNPGVHSFATIDPETGVEGTLMIIGGGQLEDGIFEQFKELAGGSRGAIVVIPSAGSDNYLDQDNTLINIEKKFHEIN